MTKRTSPADASRISTAAELEDIVQDKRAEWGATGAKARRRQRRYKTLLTQQLLHMNGANDMLDGEDDPGIWQKS